MQTGQVVQAKLGLSVLLDWLSDKETFWKKTEWISKQTEEAN